MVCFAKTLRRQNPYATAAITAIREADSIRKYRKSFRRRRATKHNNVNNMTYRARAVATVQYDVPATRIGRGLGYFCVIDSPDNGFRERRRTGRHRR